MDLEEAQERLEAGIKTHDLGEVVAAVVEDGADVNKPHLFRGWPPILWCGGLGRSRGRFGRSALFGGTTESKCNRNPTEPSGNDTTQYCTQPFHSQPESVNSDPFSYNSRSNRRFQCTICYHDDDTTSDTDTNPSGL